MMRRWALILALASTACATYDQRMEDIHRAYYDGRLPEAVAALEAEVQTSDNATVGLVQLELASAYQAAGRFSESALALSRVDQGLEVLDYTTNTPEDVAGFVLASDLQTWKASPPERLLLNTEAMIDYLVLGDLEGAQVEARRARILLSQEDVADEDRYPNPFVLALGGFCMDQGGNAAETADFWSQLSDNPLRSDAPAQKGTGTVLVVAQLGKAPIRRDASFGVVCGGVVHVMRIPAIVDRPDDFSAARVSLDDADRGEVPTIFDLGAHILDRFAKERPILLAAAAFQAAARGLIAHAVQKEGFENADSVQDVDLASLWGSIASVGMAALQPPDTRCWGLAPQSLGAMRIDNVPAGAHTVRVTLSGTSQRTLEFPVDVPAGGFACVNVVSGPYEGYDAPPSMGSMNLDENDVDAALALAIICVGSVEATY